MNPPLTPLEAFKLSAYRKRYPGFMSVAECYNLAENADDLLKQLPAGDPARVYFHNQREDFLNYSVLLEKEANQSG